MMTLKRLLELVGREAGPAVRIDSRRVEAGDVFVAIRGTACDGHDFIDQALAHGAKYVVCQENHEVPAATAGPLQWERIVVKDSTQAAGALAQAARGNPAAQLTNLAVTGTNGKTTVAFLVHACLRHAGETCGLIGTVVTDTGAGITASTLTTPDAITIARAQQQMVQAGARYMVLEASSHALHQNRLAGIDFAAAAFTNLSGDHLDYHKTEEDYLAAKTRLFSALAPGATAVLNQQAPQSQSIARATRARIWWYAVDEPADLTARIESMTVEGTRFTSRSPARDRRHRSRRRFPVATTSRTTWPRPGCAWPPVSTWRPSPQDSRRCKRYRAGWRKSAMATSRSSSITPTPTMRWRRC